MLWYSLNIINEVKAIIKKNNIHDFESLLRINKNERIKTNDFSPRFGPTGQDDWDGESYSWFIDKYHGKLKYEEKQIPDSIPHYEELNTLHIKDKDEEDDDLDDEDDPFDDYDENSKFDDIDDVGDDEF